jgi:hypothetical protein
MGLLRRRRRPKLRNDDVKIVHLEPRRPRYALGVSGERLREAFERKLDAREPEELLEPPGGEADGPLDSPPAAELQALASPSGAEPAQLVGLDVPASDGADDEIAL